MRTRGGGSVGAADPVAGAWVGRSVGGGGEPRARGGAPRCEGAPRAALEGSRRVAPRGMSLPRGLVAGAGPELFSQPPGGPRAGRSPPGHDERPGAGGCGRVGGRGRGSSGSPDAVDADPEPRSLSSDGPDASELAQQPISRRGRGLGGVGGGERAVDEASPGPRTCAPGPRTCAPGRAPPTCSPPDGHGSLADGERARGALRALRPSLGKAIPQSFGALLDPQIDAPRQTRVQRPVVRRRKQQEARRRHRG